MKRSSTFVLVVPLWENESDAETVLPDTEEEYRVGGRIHKRFINTVNERFRQKKKKPNKPLDGEMLKKRFTSLSGPENYPGLIALAANKEIFDASPSQHKKTRFEVGENTAL